MNVYCNAKNYLYPLHIVHIRLVLVFLSQLWMCTVTSPHHRSKLYVVNHWARFNSAYPI